MKQYTSGWERLIKMRPLLSAVLLLLWESIIKRNWKVCSGIVARAPLIQAAQFHVSNIVWVFHSLSLLSVFNYPPSLSARRALYTPPSPVTQWRITLSKDDLSMTLTIPLMTSRESPILSSFSLSLLLKSNQFFNRSFTQTPRVAQKLLLYSPHSLSLSLPIQRNIIIDWLYTQGSVCVEVW